MPSTPQLRPAALLAVLHALETGTAMWLVLVETALVFVIVQAIQEVLLIPKIMGKTMGLSPAMILLSLAASGKWVRIEETLALWRWAGDRVGRWADVRTLALAVEQPVEELHVDDVKLLSGATDHAAYAEATWLVRLAFADRPTKVLHEDGFLIATDAERLSEADLRKLLLRLKRTRTGHAAPAGSWAVQWSDCCRIVTIGRNRAQLR